MSYKYVTMYYYHLILHDRPDVLITALLYYCITVLLYTAILYHINLYCITVISYQLYYRPDVLRRGELLAGCEAVGAEAPR